MRVIKKFLSAVALASLVAMTAPSVQAQTNDGPDVSGLALKDPVIVDAALATATGRVELVVQLGDAPLALASAGRSRGDRQSYQRGLDGRQNELLAQIRALGGIERGRLTRAINAVIVEIDAAQIGAIETLTNVRSIRAVGSYELDLSETVPYIGATAVQQAGYDGSGVSVAVLDSGIDYTHAALGGPGTLAAYEAAYGTSPADPRNTTRDGLFPTAKVVEGFDFVGEQWPNGPRTEDPDPIDYEGHGTHVADIIGGTKGVAPGVDLYAVKVCSAVATSCNGIALLLGMDYILDPNGDGDIDDKVDVANLSLGSSYGQREDDLSEASANAVRAGVVVVTSAGNSADRPYIVGSPSSTPEVISVAQTQVPSAKTFPLKINTPGSIAALYPNTATVDWAPIGAGFTGDVVYIGRGCNADTYLANPAGKVALVDRGVCNVSEKVRRASDAGAIGVLVGLIAPGDAVTFSNGGQCPVPPDGTCKPTLIIIQAYANLIKANLGSGVNVTVGPEVAIALVGSVVGSSSRGPTSSFNTIKPDIGAPGASVSAIAGTGTGVEPFGGTSGAAPVVAGAAALLLDAYPGRSPLEIKALLMNTGERNILTNPATEPGGLAPITRIGGGEVRVDRALASDTATWDLAARIPSLSFGFQPLSTSKSFTKRIYVRNYSNKAQVYTITPSFRYSNDATSGAIQLYAPERLTVQANSAANFTFRISVDASKLPTWTLNGGLNGGNGSLLQSVEFDGYVVLTSSNDEVALPWQILPQRSSEVVRTSTSTVRLKNGVGSFRLQNKSKVLDGLVDVFSLTGSSPRISRNFLPGAGDNFAVIDLHHVGVRQAGSAIQFGINTYGRRATPNYPAEFDVYIDNNRDGTFDYVIYNGELGGFAVTGQNVVNVLNLATGAATAYFYTDADLNSENIILTAPLAALGLTPSTKFDFSVFAFDNYFTGENTDAIENMTYTLGTPRYAASIDVVPAGTTREVAVQAVAGGKEASPSQIGLLLLVRNNKVAEEAIAVRVSE